MPAASALAKLDAIPSVIGTNDEPRSFEQRDPVPDPRKAEPMKLFALRAELAVMNILSEHRIRASELLGVPTLSASWRRYGLRERDLPHAISRLRALGLIEQHRKRGQRCVMLTDDGAAWLRSPRSVISRLLLLPRYLRAQMSQFLSLAEAADEPVRRATDHPRRET